MVDFVSIPAIRQLAWRIGRRLYCWARRDAPNNPVTNGEYWLLEKLLDRQHATAPILMDIGANQGNWTAQACEILNRLRQPGQVYAFEPTASTYAHLTNRFTAEDRVRLNKIALSERNGDADFYVVGELAGTNSLHSVQGAVAEKVQTQRVDDFLALTGLGKVLFVKCDTEGHDLSVIRGAEKSLRQGLIEVWQFEYNHRWVANHSLLKDVFDFVEDKPYRLGKLYGDGIEVYDRWHPELERYFEANYILIRIGSNAEKLCSFVRFNVSNVLSRTQ